MRGKSPVPTTVCADHVVPPLAEHTIFGVVATPEAKFRHVRYTRSCFSLEYALRSAAMCSWSGVVHTFGVAAGHTTALLRKAKLCPLFFETDRLSVFALVGNPIHE